MDKDDQLWLYQVDSGNDIWLSELNLTPAQPSQPEPQPLTYADGQEVRRDDRVVGQYHMEYQVVFIDPKLTRVMVLQVFTDEEYNDAAHWDTPKAFTLLYRADQARKEPL